MIRQRERAGRDHGGAGTDAYTHSLLVPAAGSPWLLLLRLGFPGDALEAFAVGRRCG